MTHITRLAVTFALVFALLTAPAPAATAGSPAVPVSPYNARWPREPASGPLPPASPVPASASAPSQRHHWTLASIAGAALVLATCTAVAQRRHVRPRVVA